VALASPLSVLEPEQVAGYCCVPQTPAYTRQTPQTVRSWRQQSARSSTCAGARAHDQARDRVRPSSHDLGHHRLLRALPRNWICKLPLVANCPSLDFQKKLPGNRASANSVGGSGEAAGRSWVRAVGRAVGR
jgi:hypothetical protein